MTSKQQRKANVNRVLPWKHHRMKHANMENNKPKNYRKLNVEKSLSLIASIKSRPILWKRVSRNHKTKRQQDVAWKEVAVRERCTVQEAKHQWQVLLSCFRTYRAKVRKSQKHETDENLSQECREVYTPCWFAYKSMLFVSSASDVDDMQDTMSTSITTTGKESPNDSGPSELTEQPPVYSGDENSCPAFSYHQHVSMGSDSPDAASQDPFPAPSAGQSFPRIENPSDRWGKDEREETFPRIVAVPMDVLNGTSQHLRSTAAVIGNEVARWIESFEPRLRNLAIGRLYIAMHQIDQETRTGP
ncbi:uncharacterized protein LOC118516352 isoform X2 [Anopheles stephensi]|uniref:uncharacterized protein LOC118516352 isoform X2 n=1 Tax=Anopheles stephensi TaxID=30069 RepID=UPI001658919F|nr:uncharacterized protein LOC118516352 isoform X2 [Anopheles stephensi]